MKIQVTEEDILMGLPGDVCHCPVARAVKRHAPEGVDVSVHNDSVEVRVFLNGVAVPLPEDVVEFVHYFDENMDVEPIEFELPDVPPTDRTQALANAVRALSEKMKSADSTARLLIHETDSVFDGFLRFGHKGIISAINCSSLEDVLIELAKDLGGKNDHR